MLDAHATDCCHTQRTKFPDDPRCRFTNIQKQLPAPFAVYAESILKPVDKEVDTTQGVEVGRESSSHVFQEHIPCSFAYEVVSSVDPNVSRQLVMYRGEDAAEEFVRYLQQEAKQLFHDYITTPKSMLLTSTELQSFNHGTTCHICAKPLGDDEVRDHCHIVGSYRGAAHSESNLMYRISKSGLHLPVVIHNLTGYDGHLIVKALKSEFGRVRVIPHNMEKYLSVTVGLKFIDSFQFTTKGLDILAKTLAGDEFRYLRDSCTCNHFGLIRCTDLTRLNYLHMVVLVRTRSIHTQLECGLPLGVGQ